MIIIPVVEKNSTCRQSKDTAFVSHKWSPAQLISMKIRVQRLKPKEHQMLYNREWRKSWIYMFASDTPTNGKVIANTSSQKVMKKINKP